VIIQESKKHYRKTLHELGQFVSPTVCNKSVQTTLTSHRLYHRKARKVVYLPKAHTIAQRKWAKDSKIFMVDDWTQIILSDECYMYIGDDSGTIWVMWFADKEYDDDCVIPTFKWSLLQVMIWECIMVEDKGPVVVFE
jgi:hypothetical protein